MKDNCIACRLAYNFAIEKLLSPMMGYEECLEMCIRDSFHHCTTDWDRHIKENRCLCSDPKGWVCAARINEKIMYSGWSEHGMCEMWTRIPCEN